MRKLLLWTSLLALALLAGCSSGGGHASGGGDPAGNSAPPATSTPATSTAATSTAAGGAGGGATSDACSHGVKPTDPGVVDVNCGGTADVKVQVDSVSKDLPGGTCHNVPGQIWTVSVGVIVDITGQHGKYAGPQVDTIEVATNGNNAATVMGTLDAKMILSNDDAKLTLSPDGRTAHIEGVGDHNSDTPNAKITVDVTC